MSISKVHQHAHKLLPEVCILALGIVLYTFQLGQESLWIDEILSLGSAQGQLDLNRPLYFILLRFWMLISQDEAWLRTLSLLFGIGCISFTYSLGRRLVTRSVGLLAALLFALSPLAINHAQEVRYYTMSTFLGLAGSLCLSYALQQLRPWPLFGWICCRCLGFLTAQPNILLLVPDLVMIVWLLSRGTQKNTKKVSGFQRVYWRWALLFLLIPTAIILNDVIPPLIEFLFNQKWYSGAVKAPTFSNLVGLLTTLTAWPLQGPDHPGIKFFYRYFFSLYAVVIICLLCLPLVSQKWRSPQLVWIALWGLLPIGCIFLLSQFFPFLWLERYAVIAIPYVVILLAAGWTYLWDHRKRLAILVAMLYIVAVSGPLLRYYTSNYNADWRGLAHAISHYEKPNDTVVIYPGSFLPYITHYYDGNSTLLPIENIDSYEDIDIDQLASQIQSLSLVNSRFWLVCPIQNQWDDVKDALIEQLQVNGFSLQQEFRLVNHWNWGPMLYLFSS